MISGRAAHGVRRLVVWHPRTFHSSTRVNTFKITEPPNPTWKLGQELPHPEETRQTWNLDETTPVQAYKLLTSALIPRPIALVSTLSKDGIPNLAPFSYFSMVAHHPPLISLAFSLPTRVGGRPKDTRENILATKEFTVNIISETFAEAANATSTEAPADVDEWLLSGLTMEPSIGVKPAYVKESAVSLECELYSSQDIRPSGSDVITSTLVLGLIKKVHIKPSVLSNDGNQVDPGKLKPISRLGGSSYGRLSEGFDLERWKWKDVKVARQSLAAGKKD